MSRVGNTEQRQTQSSQAAAATVDGGRAAATDRAQSTPKTAKSAKPASSAAPRDGAEVVTEPGSAGAKAEQMTDNKSDMFGFLSDEVRDRMRDAALRSMTPAQHKSVDIARLGPLAKDADETADRLEKYPVSELDQLINREISTGITAANTVLDLAITFELTVTAAAPFAMFGLTVLGGVVLLNQLGEANLAGQHEGKKRDLVRDYARGVAAALDPDMRVKPFANKKRGLAFDAGYRRVKEMSKDEQQDLAASLKREGERLSGFDKKAVGETYAKSTLNAWEFRNARYN